jgi:hypothetical protein
MIHPVDPIPDPPPKVRCSRRKWLEQQLDEIEAAGFYGKISLLYENGKLQRLIREQSLTPHNDR